jgi:hypothetical protein
VIRLKKMLELPKREYGLESAIAAANVRLPTAVSPV